jgi:hypothetical protein
VAVDGRGRVTCPASSSGTRRTSRPRTASVPSWPAISTRGRCATRWTRARAPATPTARTTGPSSTSPPNEPPARRDRHARGPRPGRPVRRARHALGADHRDVVQPRCRHRINASGRSRPGSSR